MPPSTRPNCWRRWPERDRSDTVASLLDYATTRIAHALGLDRLEARLEARVLAAFAWNVDPAWLIAHDTDPPTSAGTERFESLIQRRLAGEPIAYITGQREFYGRICRDMVTLFTGLIPGIRGAEVIGPVSPASGPITVSDTRYALAEAPQVNGIITGPTTLSFALHIATPAYRNRGELALDLSRVLAREAELLQAAGVAMIQIDEPVLSTGAADIQNAAEALQHAISGLSVPVCLHVCGNLTSLLPDLLSFPVSILDFEFARSPANLALCREFDFGKKMVGFAHISASA